MYKCEKCVTDKSWYWRCKDNPKYANYPTLSYFSEYKPLCPQGYYDCVMDPAYIKFHHPEWYKELYGDMTPEEVVAKNCDPFNEYCYDDEDK